MKNHWFFLLHDMRVLVSCRTNAKIESEVEVLVETKKGLRGTLAALQRRGRSKEKVAVWSILLLSKHI